MSHRAMTGLLILSMAVNLLLAGLIIGHVMRSEGDRQFPLAWAFQEVSPEIRQKVRPIVRPHVREIMVERRDLRRSERELRRLIQSDTLTREELEVALSGMREATSAYHEFIHGVGVDVLLSLDVDERMAAAPYLFRPPRPTRGASDRERDRDERRRSQ